LAISHAIDTLLKIIIGYGFQLTCLFSLISRFRASFTADYARPTIADGCCIYLSLLAYHCIEASHWLTPPITPADNIDIDAAMLMMPDRHGCGHSQLHCHCRATAIEMPLLHTLSQLR